MIDELEKEFRSIGIEIKSHGYYKTIGEIFEELKNKWNFIPLNDRDDFISSISMMLEGGDIIILLMILSLFLLKMGLGKELLCILVPPTCKVYIMRFKKLSPIVWMNTIWVMEIELKLVLVLIIWL